MNRCMLGSDAPVSTQLGPGGSFSDWVTLVRRVIGEDDWSAVSRTTAESFYLSGTRTLNALAGQGRVSVPKRRGASGAAAGPTGTELKKLDQLDHDQVATPWHSGE